MGDLLPKSAKDKLENTCKKIVGEVSKAVPGEKNPGKVRNLLNKSLCKEARKLDQHALKLIAQQLAKVGKAHSATPPKYAPPQVKGVGTLKKPGSGVPSITIPLKSFNLPDNLGTGNLKLKIWADPRDLRGTEKGVFLNFSIQI